MVTGSSINEVWLKLLKKCYHYGIPLAPKGVLTKTLICSTMKLTNPRDRVLNIEGRKSSFRYSVAEWFWYMSGKNDLEFISKYAPSMEKFSDDGKTIRSGYGYKMFRPYLDGQTQVEYVINKLMSDRDSRQAVIMIREPEDTLHDIRMGLKSKDIPCTLSLHFMIINNKLTLIVNMRSQDLMVGKVYDIFTFTMLQEYIAMALEVDLGDFIMVDNNLHIYERWFEKANNILETVQPPSQPMPSMNSFGYWENLRKIIE